MSGDGLLPGRARRGRDREGRLSRPGPGARTRAAWCSCRAPPRATACGCASPRCTPAGPRARSSRCSAPSPDRRPSPCPYGRAAAAAPTRTTATRAELRLKERSCASRWRARARPGTARSPCTRRPRRAGASAPRCTSRRRRGAAPGAAEEGTPRVVDLEACLQLSPAMNGAARGLHAALAARPELARARPRPRARRVAGRQARSWRPSRPALGRHEAPALVALRGACPGSPASACARGRGALEWLCGHALRGASVLGRRACARTRRPSSRPTASCSSRSRGRSSELVPAGGRGPRPLRGRRPLRPAARRARRLRRGRRAARSRPRTRAANARRAGLGAAARAHRRRARGARAAARAGEASDRARSAAHRRRARRGRGDRGAAARGVVYVSCDPPTLGRDLALFAARGYRPDAVRPFDMFPDTFHLETVVRLCGGRRVL